MEINEAYNNGLTTIIIRMYTIVICYKSVQSTPHDLLYNPHNQLHIICYIIYTNQDGAMMLPSKENKNFASASGHIH